MVVLDHLIVMRKQQYFILLCLIALYGGLIDWMFVLFILCGFPCAIVRYARH